MFRKYVKVLAIICAATLTMTSTSVTAMAGSTSDLPAAGAALSLNEGTSIEQVCANASSAKTPEAPEEKLETETAAAAVEAEAPSPSVSLTAGAADSELYIVPYNKKADKTVSIEGSIEDTITIIEEEGSVSENDAEDFSKLVIAQVNDYVNVRSMPSEEGEILGKLYDDSVGEFISEQDGWNENKSVNDQDYLKDKYEVTGDDAVVLAKEVGKRIATVTTTTLFVRQEPTTDSPVIGMVPIEDELSVAEEGVTDGWIKVSVEEGEGYVSTEFVTLSTEFVQAESKEEEAERLAAEEAERKKAIAAAGKSEASKSGASVSGGSGAGSSVASYALQFVGNPYVYGGSSLTNGTDCSGFVMSVYAHFGVGLPHSSGAQRGCGYDVGGLGNAQPGDIVCYSGHVGIYIGNGQIVHASTAATGIKVSNASYRQVLSVRRIF